MESGGKIHSLLKWLLHEASPEIIWRHENLETR